MSAANRAPLTVLDATYGVFAIVLSAAAWHGWMNGEGGLSTFWLFSVALVLNLLASLLTRQVDHPLVIEISRAGMGGIVGTLAYLWADGPLGGWWGVYLTMCLGGSVMLGLLTRSTAAGHRLAVYYLGVFAAAEAFGRPEPDWYRFLENGGVLLAASITVTQAVALLARSLDAEGQQRRAAERAHQAAEDMMRRQADAAARAGVDSALRFVLEGTAGRTGDDFFHSLARSLAAALDVKHAFVAEVTDTPPTRVRTLAFWSRGQLEPNISYPLAGTPCEGVVRGDLCYYPQQVRERFPEDEALTVLEAESYLGSPIVARDGVVLGHVAVMDDRPMWDEQWRSTVLRIFGARAGAELERQRVEAELRGANEALAARLAERGGVGLADA